MTLDDSPYVVVCDAGCPVSNEDCLVTVYAIRYHPVSGDEFLTYHHLCPWCAEQIESSPAYIGTDIDVARWMARVQQ
jgi:hypothetical protein